MPEQTSPEPLEPTPIRPLLTREAIREVADDIETVLVPCPEWGGDILIRGLTGAEWSNFENSIVHYKGDKTVRNNKNLSARLIVLAAVDDKGQRLFAEDDASWLAKRSGKVLRRLADVASSLAGVSKDDMETLKENFGVTPVGS
jgi:hypothetical protein